MKDKQKKQKRLEEARKKLRIGAYCMEKYKDNMDPSSTVFLSGTRRCPDA